jgi:serine/threonine-protein kinase RsbW
MAASPRPQPDAGLRVSLEVEIPSDVAYIERVVDLVRHSCSELAFNPHQLALNVPVALSEALSNAILRGNLEDPAKRVRVRAQVDTSRLILEVADEGGWFDLDADTRDATDPDNLEREDGRGLFLMRALMDRVERFDALPGTVHGHTQGNVVRLTLSRA